MRARRSLRQGLYNGDSRRGGRAADNLVRNVVFPWALRESSFENLPMAIVSAYAGGSERGFTEPG